MSGRTISVLQHQNRYHAVDSACFHMGGPLGEQGDIEELGGNACLVCPWHGRKVSMHVSLTDWSRMWRTLHQMELNGSLNNSNKSMAANGHNCCYFVKHQGHLWDKQPNAAYFCRISLQALSFLMLWHYQGRLTRAASNWNWVPCRLTSLLGAKLTQTLMAHLAPLTTESRGYMPQPQTPLGGSGDPALPFIAPESWS